VSPMPDLAWRLTRMGGRRALLSTGLTALAVAVATLLIQFAVAGNAAFAERAERTEWRNPEPADDGTILIASTVDYYKGHAVTRIDLASLDTDTPAPAPPGLDAFPEPGDLWLSPALAALLNDIPHSEFLDRYTGETEGAIGAAALTNPGELLVVVGRDADHPTMTTTRHSVDTVSPRVVDGFASGNAEAAYTLYQVLMVLATILIVVPVGIFGAAAARLTVARRDERLATLRLIGATPGQVVRLTLVETMLAALIGSVAGTAIWLAATPLFARIPIDGGPWYVADLWAAPLWTAGVMAAVPLLVGCSAVIGLRSVVISPLGVARRVSTPGLKAIRAVVFVAMAIAFIITTQLLGAGDAAVIATIALLLLAGTLAAFNLMGPWVVQILGRLLARTARRTPRMLAARRLVDDPKAAWRTVSGIALAGFVAGFTALLPLIIVHTEPRETETLAVAVPSDDAEAIAAQVHSALDGTGEVAIADTAPMLDLGSAVPFDDDEPLFVPAGDDDSLLLITTPGDSVEATRTILTAVIPGDPPVHAADEWTSSNRYMASIRVGVTVVLAVVFATAAISAAVNGIGSVLDRRRTYRLLHLSGTPMEVLDRARTFETLLPLLILGGASILFGMLLAAPVVGFLGLDISGLIILTVTLVIGTAAVLAAGAVAKPLLRSAMADASPQAD
jgi:cell division protein FtsX